MRIVDPDSLCEVPPERVGEIWVAGPSVTCGYWSGDTADLFGSLAGEHAQQFLRTGDLGFISDEELYVVGRIKDLIVINGRNYHAEDIEDAINCCHPQLKSNSAVAFGATTGEMEVLVIVQEVSLRVKNEEIDAITAAIRNRIMQDFGVVVPTVAYVRSNRIPRTSSGKKRRNACRNLYLSEKFDPIKIDKANALDRFVPVLDHKDIESGSGEELSAIATRVIKEFCARRLGVGPEYVDGEASLPQLGLDSLAAMELRSLLYRQLAIDISLDQITITPISKLAESSTVKVSAAAPEQVLGRGVGLTHGDDGTLSIGQKALWFLQRIEPDSDAYTIMRLLEIQGPLDEVALSACFAELGQRHKILRSSIDDNHGEPTFHINPDLDIEVIDLSEAAEDSIRMRIEEIRKKRHTANRSALFEVHLFRQSPTRSILFLAAHHMVVDLHSLMVLLREVVCIYAAQRRHAGCELPASLQFRDFVAWQSSLLACEAGNQLRTYWERSLSGPVQHLQLSAAGDRRTGSSGTRRFRIERGTLERAALLARRWGCTVHALILSVYGIVLHRYSGQTQFCVAIVSSGRTESGFVDVVGYFANLLPVQIAVRPQSTFKSVTEAVYREVVGALKHQDLPYSHIVDRLRGRLTSNRQPLITTVCMWQSSTKRNGNISGFVLGEAGSVYQCDNIRIESLKCESRQTQFELALMCVENPEWLDCVLQYDQGCFRSELIDGIAENIISLSELLIEEPDRFIRSIETPVSELVNEGVQRENATSYVVRGECVHKQIQHAARKFPQRTAVVHRSAAITFRDLQREANRIANYLKHLGIGPESRVAIMAERSIAMVVGIVGILNAGAAYVPLDPASPIDRLEMIVSEAGARIILASENCSARWKDKRDVTVTRLECKEIADAEDSPCADGAAIKNLAYVMFTSGSTGKPKGVMVEHQSVVNFFAGMDEKVGCTESDRLLAVTSIGFDISVLELLWTLARGAEVTIADEIFPARMQGPAKKRKTPDISLFYFADSATQRAVDRYRLLIAGAKLGDAQGFSAIWTPERHFHSFGGLYPNPAITSAALAMITERIQIRGGSVVMPLHNPIRVAEDWAVIDNLSGGRAGIAVASGWHVDDFVLNPTHYKDRREIALAGIDTVRRLWRGETLRELGGNGSYTSVGIYPAPVQKEIPVWLTSSGNRATFVSAAEIEAHLLTHLLGQNISDLQEKVGTYLSLIKAKKDHPFEPCVSLMLHTYVDESWGKVRDATLKPFKEYLKSSVDLMGTFIKSAGFDLDIGSMTDRDRDDLALFAAEKYMQEGGLFGTREKCRERLAFLGEMGVTEVACLVDFGVDHDRVLESLYRVAEAAREVAAEARTTARATENVRQDRGVTMMQCTPTLIKTMLSDTAFRQTLGGLRVLLLGGESVPVSLAEEARKCGVQRIMNMYGPTETTVWSTACEMKAEVDRSLIRSPIINTRIHLLDENLQAVPIGAIGEIAIGGAGVARGYIGDGAQTAGRFVPDPFSEAAGARLYRTGDLARRDITGALEMLGRSDQQVKIRGHRIELGEIEAALMQIPEIETAVVVPSKAVRATDELSAYVLPKRGTSISTRYVEQILKGKLPSYMIPSHIEFIHHIPVNANGKIDRVGLLQEPVKVKAIAKAGGKIPSGMEATITAIWKDVLQVSDLSPDDNFFDVGGHSLLMAQVHQRLQEALGREFPLLHLLEAPTIHAMTRMLDTERGEAAVSTSEQAIHQRGALRALWQHAERSREVN